MMIPGPNRRVGRPRLAEAELNPLVSLSAEERKNVFLETAARLFEERGYAQTSVEEITESLGLSKGIFYYYWKNKKEILLEIHARAIAALNTQLDDVIAQIDEPGERLTGAIISHLNVVMHHRSLVAVLMGEAAFSEDTVKERRAYTERVQQLVKDAMSAGVVDPAYPPKLLTFALLGLLNSVAQWYRSDGEMSAHDIAQLYLRLAMLGCRRP